MNRNMHSGKQVKFLISFSGYTVNSHVSHVSFRKFCKRYSVILYLPLLLSSGNASSVGHDAKVLVVVLTGKLSIVERK